MSKTRQVNKQSQRIPDMSIVRNDENGRELDQRILHSKEIVPFRRQTIANFENKLN